MAAARAVACEAQNGMTLSLIADILAGVESGHRGQDRIWPDFALSFTSLFPSCCCLLERDSDYAAARSSHIDQGPATNSVPGHRWSELPVRAPCGAGKTTGRD